MVNFSCVKLKECLILKEFDPSNIFIAIVKSCDLYKVNLHIFILLNHFFFIFFIVDWMIFFLLRSIEYNFCLSLCVTFYKEFILNIKIVSTTINIMHRYYYKSISTLDLSLSDSTLLSLTKIILQSYFTLYTHHLIHWKNTIYLFNKLFFFNVKLPFICLTNYLFLKLFYNLLHINLLFFFYIFNYYILIVYLNIHIQFN